MAPRPRRIQSLYPSALQDGCFLVEFYVAHPNDVRFNAINQRFWLKYRDHAAPTFGSINAHLITPSDTSEDRASRQNLVPVRCWVNLTHNDTYIHGPFDFASVRGQKTRDRICLDDWNVILAKSSMFVNKVPKLDSILFRPCGSRHSLYLPWHDRSFPL